MQESQRLPLPEMQETTLHRKDTHKCMHSRWIIREIIEFYLMYTANLPCVDKQWSVNNALWVAPGADITQN
jgi:hypothetical protein